MTRFARLALTLSLGALAVSLAACGGRPADVVLYCAVDRAHSEPIVRAFEEHTGLKVDFVPDIEASKSVGHRRRLQEEANNPRCDVFWNNEIVQTVLLQEQGLLAPYTPQGSEDIPAVFKDPEGYWTAFGARGRVLIANTELLPDASSRLTGMADFLNPERAARAGMAKPLTGTTATHAAWLIADRGLQATLAQFDAMRAAGTAFGASNGQMMRLVRDGELDFAWTDTDDVRTALAEDYPVVQIVPDQGPGDDGLLVIPNTVMLIKGAPHPDAAQRLIDYLSSAEVEEMLAHGPSAQIPVRASVPRPAHVLALQDYELAEVDWAAVGRAYAEHGAALDAHFLR
ncbi:MAG: iron transporter [Planctomycetota bacterium]|nr:MAG: iron transporter [Planctomycetota bacterium]